MFILCVIKSKKERAPGLQPAGSIEDASGASLADCDRVQHQGFRLRDSADHGLGWRKRSQMAYIDRFWEYL